MKFAWPWAFLLFGPLLLMAWRGWKARSTEALPFSSLAAFAACPPTWRQRLSRKLVYVRLATLSLLIFTLSRPELELIEPAPPREGIAMEIVVDLSSSMETDMPYEGGSQSRIAIVRRVLGDFVDGKGEFGGRSNDLIGLITFARFADTICPFTLDHSTLAFFIKNLAAQAKPNEDGTAIGDALALAAARLRTVEEQLQHGLFGRAKDYEIKSKVILLLTDGENNCGRHLPLEAAALAKAWGIRIHIISIAPDTTTRSVTSPLGVVQVTEPPDPAQVVLKQIAEESGGLYRTVDDGNALRKICGQIDTLEKSRIQTSGLRRYQPCYAPFAVAALLLLLAQALLETLWLRRTP